MAGRVAVIGGALVDVRAATAEGWEPGRSLPGRARILAGGAARNTAVNLSRLGLDVSLLTAVGDDPMGDWLLEATAGAGVDVSNVVRRPRVTALFICVSPEGSPGWCVSDAGIIETLDPDEEDLKAWHAVLAEAQIVIADANLSAAALAHVARLASANPRVLLATSPAKAPRLRSVLQSSAIVVCNRDEALGLTGLPPTLSWQALGIALLTDGVERAVITQGGGGVGVVTAEGTGFAAARDVAIIDTSGAGDAAAAAAIYAYRQGMDPEAMAELAAEAASIVVQSEENTPEALRQAIVRNNRRHE